LPLPCDVDICALQPTPARLEDEKDKEDKEEEEEEEAKPVDCCLVARSPPRE